MVQQFSQLIKCYNDSQGKHFLFNVTISIIKSHYSVFLITISYTADEVKNGD